MAERPFQLALHEAAIRFLEGVQPKIYKQIMRRVLDLTGQPFPDGYKKLRGADEVGATFRERAGDYRIIYQVKGCTVTILDIDDRKEVYRGM